MSSTAPLAPIEIDLRAILSLRRRRVALHSIRRPHSRAVSIQENARCPEDILKHLWRQHARVGVVARAVIADEEAQLSDLVRRPVAERRGGAAVVERGHRALMGNPPERDDGAKISHLGDGGFEKSAAGLDLGRSGLVLRWHAPHRVGDPRIDKGQAIIRSRFIAAASKLEMLERFVEEIAGVIAGEWSTCAVRALEAGSQAHDQKPRITSTERSYRRVEPVGLAATPIFSERLETWTARAVAAGFAGCVGHCGAWSIFRKSGHRFSAENATNRRVQSSKSSSSIAAPAPARCGVVGRCRNCGV